MLPNKFMGGTNTCEAVPALCEAYSVVCCADAGGAAAATGAADEDHNATLLPGLCTLPKAPLPPTPSLRHDGNICGWVADDCDKSVAPAAQ